MWEQFFIVPLIKGYQRSQLLITQWEDVSYTILESVALYSNINALSNLIKSEELERSQLQKIRLQNMFAYFKLRILPWQYFCCTPKQLS